MSSGESGARDDAARGRSEAFFRAVLEKSPDPLFVIGRDGRFKFASAAALSFYGLTEETLATTVVGSLVHPGDREAAVGLLATLAEPGRSGGVTYRGRRADGAYRTMESTAFNLLDVPEVDGFVIHSHDVTEHREMVDRLHFATVSAKAGVWDWSFPTNEMVWDDRMLELYGLDRESFPGGVEAWQRGLHPEDRDRAVEDCQAALRGERSFDTEFRVNRPDGGVTYIKANGLVLRDQGGKPVRMIGLNVDITDRKQAEIGKAKLEAQLLQAQRLESVGRLAGGVAHDFNNMLTVILANAESALLRVDSQPLRDDLEEIRAAAARSVDLTRQLLAFARQQTVAPKVVDLSDIVAGMTRMLERLIGEDIRLTVTSAPGLWRVKVDPTQVDQVLANLCVNARDAISGVGTLRIATGNVTLDAEACEGRPGALPGEYVWLSVTDSGCGMDQATISRIFEPFFTTKELGKGTGLGLATLHGIVAQNGGFVTVDSEPGRGTTFTIFLPRHVVAVEPARALEPPAPSVAVHETILLVEDEPSILKATRRMLERLGYTVRAARTPDEAFQMAEQDGEPVDLLLTDVIMPDMNGRDLATKLQSLQPGLKTLFMSGYTADIIAESGVLDDGVAFIQKPFSNLDLATKVRGVLDRASSR